MSAKVSLSRDEKKELVGRLANQAAVAPLQMGAKGYMRYLINETNWPGGFKTMRIGALTGIAKFDAQELVNWALVQGGNPEDERYTVLGGLLEVLIEDVGREDARWIAALIAARGLFQDESLLDNLRIPVPREVTKGVEVITDYGPEIEWRGPTDDVELQSLLPPELDFLDHRDVYLMLKRAESVCRIEFDKLDRPATGFLIADDLLLTNYHVFEHPHFPEDDFDENFHDAKLYFGKVTTEEGKVTEGQAFEPVSVLAKSRWDKLDYVLIKMEERIKRAEGIGPATYDLEIPKRATGLHLIGHPGRIEGEAIQFALSTSGVTDIDEEKGYIQYWTRAAGGSSGSPCFNEDWNAVAVHQSQRSVGLVKRRTGILFRSIYEEIKEYL
jgi:V8-like Glu-specific endopeptidase